MSFFPQEQGETRGREGVVWKMEGERRGSRGGAKRKKTGPLSSEDQSLVLVRFLFLCFLFPSLLSTYLSTQLPTYLYSLASLTAVGELSPCAKTAAFLMNGVWGKGREEGRESVQVGVGVWDTLRARGAYTALRESEREVKKSGAMKT